MADDAKVEPNFTVAYILNSCWRHGIAVAYTGRRDKGCRLSSNCRMWPWQKSQGKNCWCQVDATVHVPAPHSDDVSKKAIMVWKWSSPGESGTGATAEGTVAAVGRSCQVCNCFHSHRTCRPWAPQFLRPPTVIFLEIANLACFLSDTVAGGQSAARLSRPGWRKGYWSNRKPPVMRHPLCGSADFLHLPIGQAVNVTSTAMLQATHSDNTTRNCCSLMVPQGRSFAYPWQPAKKIVQWVKTWNTDQTAAQDDGAKPPSFSPMSWNKLQALWEREEAVPNCVRHAWNTRWHSTCRNMEET